jgi:hypothetical protein
MRITIETAPTWGGDDCTADLAKYAATLTESYLGTHYDLEASHLVVQVQTADYGPKFPSEPVGTITIDYRQETPQ